MNVCETCKDYQTQPSGNGKCMLYPMITTYDVFVLDCPCCECIVKPICERDCDLITKHFENIFVKIIRKSREENKAKKKKGG